MDFTNTGFQANPGRSTGSGVRTLIDGRWVDQDSPEGKRHMSNLISMNQKRVADDAKRKTDIERSKALLELNDRSSELASGLANARVNAAAGSEARGMSRRVHRRRGASAFAALGKLQAENIKTQTDSVNKIFDQIQTDRTKSSPAFAAMAPKIGIRPPKIK